MRLVLPLVILGLLALTASVLVALFRSTPDDSAPAPRLDQVRRVTSIGPPAAPQERWRRRMTICRTQGHTWRVAFPMGKLARQCRECGAIAAPIVVKAHRIARG